MKKTKQKYLDRKKTIYYWRVSKRLCTVCGKRLRRLSKIRKCEDCSKKLAAYHTKWRRTRRKLNRKTRLNDKRRNFG